MTGSASSQANYNKKSKCKFLRLYVSHLQLCLDSTQDQVILFLSLEFYPILLPDHPQTWIHLKLKYSKQLLNLTLKVLFIFQPLFFLCSPKATVQLDHSPKSCSVYDVWSFLTHSLKSNSEWLILHLNSGAPHGTFACMLSCSVMSDSLQPCGL